MSRWCRLPCGMGRGEDTWTTLSGGIRKIRSCSRPRWRFANRAPVHVFEQARQLSEVGAGLGLQHNAQRVLVVLDLGPEMIRIGWQLKGFRGARAEARRNLRRGAFDHSVAAW